MNCGCARCNRQFPTKSHLSGHLQLTHYIAQYIKDGHKFMYECDICHYNKCVLSAFNQHLATTHRLAQIACPKCPATFKEKGSLTKHMRYRHNKEAKAHLTTRKFQCAECGKSFKRLHVLRGHSIFHKPPEFQCDECGQNFFGSRALILHYKMFHLQENFTKSTKDAKFSCTHCVWKFPDANALRKHSLMHKPKEFKCSKCFREFRTVGELNSHMYKVHCIVVVEKEHKCEICGKVCADMNALARHSLWHEIPKFGCSQCPRKYFMPAYLVRHIKRTHNATQIQYFCAICCRPFGNRKTNLTAHLTTHYQAVYSCQECQSSFSSERCLELHRQSVHKAAKDQKTELSCEIVFCGICKRTFVSRTGLLNHRKYHEEPQFSCAECSSKFYHKTLLLRHMKSRHHSDHMKGPFGCAVCTRRFHQRKPLQQHHSRHKSCNSTLPKL